VDPFSGQGLWASHIVQPGASASFTAPMSNVRPIPPHLAEPAEPPPQHPPGCISNADCDAALVGRLVPDRPIRTTHARRGTPGWTLPDCQLAHQRGNLLAEAAGDHRKAVALLAQRLTAIAVDVRARAAAIPRAAETPVLSKLADGLDARVKHLGAG